MTFEDKLIHSLDCIHDSTVKEAMIYSLMAGGKRIRPNLLYDVLKGYNVDQSVGDKFACAIEMIHTYSLIHDDLPSMDNDDLRRGKPTCHKQFGEATAVLAGDGLLTYAFELASQSEGDPTTVLECIHLLANMAGSSGMIYGQCLDISNNLSCSSIDELRKIERYKTGCLLTVPLMIGAKLSCQNNDVVHRFESIGYKIGYAFQIQDDILDATKSSDELGKTNSDLRNDKLTSVSIYGLEKSIELMNEIYNSCFTEIDQIDGFDSSFLKDRLNKIKTRSL